MHGERCPALRFGQPGRDRGLVELRREARGWPPAGIDRPQLCGAYSSGSVPDGYQRVSGPEGVSVSIPAGWAVRRGAFASTDEADAPDGSGSTIRYSGSATPVMSLTDAVAELEKNTPAIRKGYERLRLDQVAAGDVVWEFRFTTKAGVRRHALGWYWRADDHDYAVYASVDESRWVDFQPILDVLVRTAGPR